MSLLTDKRFEPCVLFLVKVALEVLTTLRNYNVTSSFLLDIEQVWKFEILEGYQFVKLRLIFYHYSLSALTLHWKNRLHNCMLQLT